MVTGLMLDSGYAFTTTRSERDVWMPRSRGPTVTRMQAVKDASIVPTLEGCLDKFVRSPPSVYSVIFGAEGTGKSALAEEVARKTPGAIYVIVPPETGSSNEVESGLDSALRVALNWSELDSVAQYVLEQVYHMPAKLQAGPNCCVHCATY